VREHASRRRGRFTVAALPSIAVGALLGVIAMFAIDYVGIKSSLRTLPPVFA
jgi:hypothetical protein